MPGAADIVVIVVVEPLSGTVATGEVVNGPDSFFPTAIEPPLALAMGEVVQTTGRL